MREILYITLSMFKFFMEVLGFYFAILLIRMYISNNNAKKKRIARKEKLKRILEDISIL